ncbi:MAG TPA: protein translocase subunit SecF [Vicinamibacterales bacterium]|nr:protein translocase subunit SecF [Vicinamibacterales bacterium]
MRIFKNPNYDFVRWTWHALVLSWVIILAGGVYIWKNGIPKGVEFSGGTIVIVKFDQVPNLDRIRTALPDGANAIVQTYGPDTSREVMIRVPSAGAEAGASLSAQAEAVVASLNSAGLGPIAGTCSPQKPSNCLSGTEIVGPTVGRELTRRGILATVFALAGILVYIALRFRISFAVGAVIATIHDLLITLVFLAVFQYEMSLNVVAALLTITGYSMNDTIVIFDRVRENMRSMRRDDLATVINTAVNQMMDRTVITGGSTLLAVTALYFFGGEVLKGFAFTMIVGIITGTYSSVFIAAAIVLLWQRRSHRKAAPAAPVAPVAPAKKSTKRRAS